MSASQAPTRVAPESAGSLFTVLSRFTVANGMADEVAAAFRARPHQVDEDAGFVRLDVLRPTESPEEFWLLTTWRDEDSYRTWYASHKYQEAHAGIPGGLKLVPGSVRIETFEHVGS